MAAPQLLDVRPFPDDRRSFASLARDSFISLAASFGFFAITYISNVVFANILSPEDYGDYAIGMTTLALGSMAALAGSGHAMTRYLPDYLTRQDYAHLSGYIRFFVPFVVATALLIASCIWIAREAADTFASTVRTAVLHPVSVAAMVIGLYALATFGNRLLRSFDFVVFSFIPTRVIAPLATLALVTGLYAMGIVVSDWLIMAAVGAGFVGAVLFEIIVLAAYGHHKLLANKPVYEVQTWLGASLSLMAAGLFSEVLHHSDLIMIEIISTDESLVGHYAAINNTVVLISLVASAITLIVAPLLGAAIGRRDFSEIQALLGDTATLAIVGCGVATIAIVVCRRPLLGLFGPTYVAAAGALVIAAVAYGISAAFAACRLYLQYLGWHRAALWPMAGGILLNIVLNAMLIGPFGIEGAALATLISLVAIRATQVTLLYRFTGLVILPFFRRQTARARRLGHHFDLDRITR